MPPHASEPDRPEAGRGRETSPSAQGPSDAQAQLEELQRRIADLEGGGRRHHHRVRSVLSVVLIVLAAVLSVLSVVAVWANSIVGDTDRYVATVGPLADNPEVQTAITNRASAAILAQIDVKALVAELSAVAAQNGVPPRAAQLIGGLTGPIESGLKELVTSTVRRVVASGAFETLWIEANRIAHSALDKALTGKGGGAVALKNDDVTIDVGPIVAKAKGELVEAGLNGPARSPMCTPTSSCSRRTTSPRSRRTSGCCRSSAPGSRSSRC